MLCAITELCSVRDIPANTCSVHEVLQLPHTLNAAMYLFGIYGIFGGDVGTVTKLRVFQSCMLLRSLSNLYEALEALKGGFAVFRVPVRGL